MHPLLTLGHVIDWGSHFRVSALEYISEQVAVEERPECDEGVSYVMLWLVLQGDGAVATEIWYPAYSLREAERKSPQCAVSGRRER